MRVERVYGIFLCGMVDDDPNAVKWSRGTFDGLSIPHTRLITTLRLIIDLFTPWMSFFDAVVHDAFPSKPAIFFFYAPVAQFSLFHCSISRLCLFMFFSIVGKSRYYFYYYVWWIKIHDFPIKKRNIWILIFSFSSSLLLISMYLFDSKMWQNTQDGQVDSGSRLVSTVFSSRRWWTLSRP